MHKDMQKSFLFKVFLAGHEIFQMWECLYIIYLEISLFPKEGER